MAKSKLSSIQIDALREVGNIASGNAATSLSMLTNEVVDMTVPEVSLVPFSEVMHIIGNPEDPVVSICFQILGEAPGVVYFILTFDDAEELAQLLTKDENFQIEKALEDDQHIGFSALMEVGNILAGTYLSALADFTKIHIQPSIPSLNIDMAGAILSEGLIKISDMTDHAILVDTSIENMEVSNSVKGKFFLMPHASLITKIFQSLGIEENE